MKNIYEILKSFGLEVPADKKEEFDKAVVENYKTIAEVKGLNDKLEKVTGERDTYKNKYDTDIKQRDADLADLKQKLANAGTDAETLKNLQKDFDTLKTNYDNAQLDYKKALDKQAYDFAIKEKVGDLKFSSKSAKNAFLTQALNKNLPMEGDVILGFDDFVSAYTQNDPDAFAKQEEDKPKPDTKPQFGGKSSGKVSDEQPPEENINDNNTPVIW